MSINHCRIDKFLGQHCQVNKREVRLMLAQKRVLVDGKVALDASQVINRFSVIRIDDQIVQALKPTYLMLHKPVGVVSATKDDKHQTVIDLLKPHYDESLLQQLHIVGRLDLNTSGLVLLTDDSRWSSQITSPSSKVTKLYRVTLAHKLSADYIDTFAKGMYFDYEGITTKPAKLDIVSDHVALVSLTEGRYHQIKRMFGRFRNPIVKLHRLAVGTVQLDESLSVGQCRKLTSEEIDSFGDIERNTEK